VDILVDTNVMLRLVNERDAQNDVALLARDSLLAQGHTLYTASQSFREFWAVCTRPVAANGLGLELAIAKEFLEASEESFSRLPESDFVYYRWRDLIIHYSVSGRQVHDAHLVASMLVNAVTHILTFNYKDFTRYPEITVIDPFTISRR
jgi:predicted nucleic acid-binding protein